MLRLALLLIVVGITMAGAARAQSLYEIASSWGLLGVWAFNCPAPRSENNAEYEYTVKNGELVLLRDFGEKRTDSVTLRAVRLLQHDQIEYVVHFVSMTPPQTRRHVLLRNADNQRMRVFQNFHFETNQAVILDGKFSDGTEGAWMHRCR